MITQFPPGYYTRDQQSTPSKVLESVPDGFAYSAPPPTSPPEKIVPSVQGPIPLPNYPMVL